MFPLHFSKTEEKFNDILREFINFCYPFIPYILFTAIAEFIDTWILIKYGGSVEQSFFTVGLNLSLSLIIFTTALLKVFWKEIAESIEEKNWKLYNNLVSRFSKLSFVISCAICGLIMPWSNEILIMIYGSEFGNGTTTFKIILIGSIYLGLNQTISIIYFSSGNTKVFVVIGIFISFLSLILVYFAIAPKNNTIPGLNLGSVGVATKYFIIQVVNFILLINFLQTKYKFSFTIKYQLTIILIISLISFMNFEFTNLIFIYETIMLKMIFNFVTYI